MIFCTTGKLSQGMTLPRSPAERWVNRVLLANPEVFPSFAECVDQPGDSFWHAAASHEIRLFFQASNRFPSVDCRNSLQFNSKSVHEGASIGNRDHARSVNVTAKHLDCGVICGGGVVGHGSQLIACGESLS